MTAVLVMVAAGLEITDHEHMALQIPAFAALILAGMVSYGLAVTFSGVIKIRDMKRYLSRG
jgi:hypothetical protein